MKDAPDDGAAMGRSQVRGSSLLVVGRMAALVLSMATQVLIVRAVSVPDFGTFAFALALAAAGRTLLSLGQGKLLSRFMATYEEERDYPRMFGAMFLAVGTIAVTSVTTISALYFLDDTLVGWGMGREAVNLLLILAFLAPVEALDQVFVSLFAVFSKPRAIFFRKYLLAPGLRLVVVLLLVATNSSVTFLAVGYVIASALGLVLYLGLLVQMLRQRGLLQELDLRRIILPFRAVFSFSFPLITSDLALLSLTAGSVVILALYQPFTEIAYYRSVFNPARLNTAITAAFVTLFLPVIARLYARRDTDGLRRTYWQTAVFVAVLTFPIFALTGPMAPQITVALFEVRYEAAAPVLSILAAGYYVNVLLGFNAYTVQVCGRIGYLVGVNLFVIVLNLGLSFALAERHGAVGMAIANCAALVAQNLLNQWALRGSIGTAFIDRSALRAYLSIAAATAVLWLFQWLVSPGLLMAVVAAGIASLAVLFASRKAMQLSQTFPELQRVPLVRRFIA